SPPPRRRSSMPSWAATPDSLAPPAAPAFAPSERRVVLAAYRRCPHGRTNRPRHPPASREPSVGAEPPTWIGPKLVSKPRAPRSAPRAAVRGVGGFGRGDGRRASRGSTRGNRRGLVAVRHARRGRLVRPCAGGAGAVRAASGGGAGPRPVGRRPDGP